MGETIYTYTPNRPKRGLKLVVYISLLFLILGIVFYKKIYPRVLSYMAETDNAKNAKVETVIEQPPAAQPAVAVKPEVVIPASAKLQVAYTVQAPHRNWTKYGEACEEAALLMNHYYLEKKTFPNDRIPAEVATAEFDKMVAFQKSHYGKEKDLSLEELGQFAHDYYGYKYRIIDNVNEGDIRSEIAQGNMVIVSVMTKTLREQGRGQYSAGNVYHVFPVIGYNEKGAVTNDNGFTQGKDWFYTWNILFSAVDQNHVNHPARKALVISKS